MLIWAFMGRRTRNQSVCLVVVCAMWGDILRIKWQWNCHKLDSMPFSPSTSKNFTDLAFLKHFRILAPNHGQKLWRTLILLQYHVPLSCHFISVMTHRFSIYATNCIEAGCGPSQSQDGPAVHLGKRRRLKWLGRARRIFVSPPWQTGSSLLATHLT